MTTANVLTRSPENSTLHHRIDEVQANWSLSQRSQRYQNVEKRMLDFLSILAPRTMDEPTILAVGAPTIEDCSRLACGR